MFKLFSVLFFMSLCSFSIGQATSLMRPSLMGAPVINLFLSQINDLHLVARGEEDIVLKETPLSLVSQLLADGGEVSASCNSVLGAQYEGCMFVIIENKETLLQKNHFFHFNGEKKDGKINLNPAVIYEVVQ